MRTPLAPRARAAILLLTFAACSDDKPGGTDGTSTTAAASTGDASTGPSTDPSTSDAPTSGTSTGDASTGEPTSSSSTTGAPLVCADAATEGACGMAKPSDEFGRCVWAEFLDVSTVSMTCSAEPKAGAGCFEVFTNLGGCGPCHYKEVAPDTFEVAVLSSGIGCANFMPGFQSCDADLEMPVFACSCSCP